MIVPWNGACPRAIRQWCIRFGWFGEMVRNSGTAECHALLGNKGCPSCRICPSLDPRLTEIEPAQTPGVHGASHGSGISARRGRAVFWPVCADSHHAGGTAVIPPRAAG